METSDVLVVGGDLAAVATAYEIQPFANVVLLGRPPHDPLPELLIASAGDGLQDRLVEAGRAFYEGPGSTLAGRSLIGRQDLLLIASARQLDELDSLGLAPAGERIAAADILRELPFLATQAPAAGFLQSGIGELDVAAAHAAYLQAFRDRGGRVVDGTDTLLIEGEGAPWRVGTGSAKFEAGVLIDAAGWFAEEVAVRAGVPPLGLQARRRAQLRFEPTVALPGAMPVLLDVDGGRRLGSADGVVTAVITDDEALDPLAIRPEREDGGWAVRLLERTTRLRVSRVLAGNSDFVAISPDDRPVVGHDDFVPGFFWVAGEGLAGAALVPGLARAAASLLVGGVLPADLIELGISPEDLLPLRLHDQREA